MPKLKCECSHAGGTGILLHLLRIPREPAEESDDSDADDGAEVTSR
jgi:hypothetical protein